MRIATLALGSRGDAQPYVALGVALKQRGHQVRLAAHENFRALVQARGLEFSPMTGDARGLARALTIDGRGRTHALRILRCLAAYTLPIGEHLWEDTRRACHGAEIVIHSLTTSYLGLRAALDQGIPAVAALLYPLFTPTRAFPSPFTPEFPLPPAFNWLTHLPFEILTRALMHTLYPLLRLRWRSLPAAPPWPYGRVRGRHTTILYGYSPSVIPKPEEWDEYRHVTGYWFLDAAADWRPPERLLHFLEAGPPPMYMGFGSMSQTDPQAAWRLLVEAARKTGQRAGLRAGVPNIVIPALADQPFWGRRVAALGVGPQPIPRGRLTVDRLAQAITRAVGDEEMRARAAELSVRIRSEKGAAAAACIIEARVAGRSSKGKPPCTGIPAEAG